MIAVPHNLAGGVRIATLGATDPDGPSDILTYSITGGNGSSYLAIDALTSDLSVFDSELSQQSVGVGQVLGLKVKVTDSGSPPLSDITTINLLVTAENRHAPVFKDTTSR